MTTVTDTVIGHQLATTIPSLEDGLYERLAVKADAQGLLDVAYRTLASRYGELLLAASPAGVLRIAFELEGHDSVLTQLAKDFSPRILRAPQRLDVAARELDE